MLDRLLAISDMFDRESLRVFADSGLTETRVRALRVLQRTGATTQRNLAQILGTTARSVSALVDGLEHAGLAQRSKHPDDRRAVLVAVTEKAERALLQIEASRELLARELVGQVDPEDREAFDRGLNAVFWRMRERAVDYAV